VVDPHGGAHPAGVEAVPEVEVLVVGDLAHRARHRVGQRRGRGATVERAILLPPAQVLGELSSDLRIDVHLFEEAGDAGDDGLPVETLRREGRNRGGIEGSGGEEDSGNRMHEGSPLHGETLENVGDNSVKAAAQNGEHDGAGGASPSPTARRGLSGSVS
jgi:hypothetical protein